VRSGVRRRVGKSVAARLVPASWYRILHGTDRDRKWWHRFSPKYRAFQYDD
jgi:hypothetical protein